MLEETSHSKAIEEATKALYILNSDMTILDQCYARQDYERMHKMIDKRMEELESKAEKLEAEKDRLATEKDKLSTEKDKLDSENARLKKLLVANNISYTE
jgi:septal ring factor EnvC (AmiA/AmiB activator)